MPSIDVSNIPRGDIRPMSPDEVRRFVNLFKDPTSKSVKPIRQEPQGDLLDEFFLLPLMRFGKRLQPESVSKANQDQDPNNVFETLDFFRELGQVHEVEKQTHIPEQNVDPRNACLQSVFDPVLDFKERR